MDIFRILVAIILPPLGVFLQERLNRRFWLNVVLTLLGYIPGIIHAVYVIAKHPSKGELKRGAKQVGRAVDPRRKAA